MYAQRVIVVGLVALAACDVRKPTQPESSELRPADEGQVATVVPPEGGVWYPENPDGSPDYYADTQLLGEWITARASFDVNATGEVDAGFSYFASGAEIGIYPDVKINGGQAYTGAVGAHQVFGPSLSAIVPASIGWTGILWDALCETSVGGFADFRTWFMDLNKLRWGEHRSTKDAQPSRAGPTCVLPTVTISPAGPITLAPGANQTFSGSGSTAGTGEIRAYEWTADGTVVGSASAWTGQWSSGTHTVSLKVTNTAGLSATNSVAVTIPEPPPPPPPTEGGGGPVEILQVYDVYCYFISNDGGVTWANTGICFLL